MRRWTARDFFSSNERPGSHDLATLVPLSSPPQGHAVPHLFSPLSLGPITLPNRIAVSPMCQYSASDGSASDWHLQHLMQYAIGRAGMIVLEATGVERAGRISHGCLGLYSDANEAALPGPTIFKSCSPRMPLVVVP